MTTKSKTRFDFPVTAGVALAAIAVTVAALAGVRLTLLLEAQRASIVDGHEWWRVVTGPLLHTNVGMLARDVATFSLLGILYERELGRRFWLLVPLGLLIPTLAVLVFEPHFSAYYGLSGLVHAMFVAAFLFEVRKGNVVWWKWLIAAVFVVKLVFETVTGNLLFAIDLGAHVTAAPLSHLVGALVGLIYVPVGLKRSG